MTTDRETQDGTSANQPEHLPRAGEEDTRAFLARQGIIADNSDTFDLARVLLADD